MVILEARALPGLYASPHANEVPRATASQPVPSTSSSDHELVRFSSSQAATTNTGIVSPRKTRSVCPATEREVGGRK